MCWMDARATESLKESSLSWCFAWKSPRMSSHPSLKLQTLHLQLTHGVCIVHPCRTLSPMTGLIGLLLGLDGSPTLGSGVQQHLYSVYMLRPYDQSAIPGIILCKGPEQVRRGGGVDITRACRAKRPSWRSLPAEHWFLLLHPCQSASIRARTQPEGDARAGA